MQDHDIQGGDELCRAFGHLAVMDALHRDKIITSVEAVTTRSNYEDWPNTPDAKAGIKRKIKYKWVVNEKWHSPGGFLVSQLRKRYGWRRD